MDGVRVKAKGVSLRPVLGLWAGGVLTTTVETLVLNPVRERRALSVVLGPPVNVKLPVLRLRLNGVPAQVLNSHMGLVRDLLVTCVKITVVDLAFSLAKDSLYQPGPNGPMESVFNESDRLIRICHFFTE